MKVLNLVTNAHSTFYRKQIDILKQSGVDCTTISPTKQSESISERKDISRSVFDYAPLYVRTIKHSSHNYDLIHANNGLTAPFALAQPHRPIVLTLWGSDLAGKYSWVSKRCAPHCDAVIVMSDEMKRELDQDAYVIPHGIDLDLFKPMSQNEAKEKVGWDKDCQYVLFPYPPSRRVKNYPLAETVYEQAKTQINDNVELKTVYSIAHDMVPVYMNAADVLLFTSRREGSPNTIKEALACNLPIVSTDVGDVSERISNVDCSYVCETEDELVGTLATVLSEKRRSNGREVVREVSLERMGKRILDVYESVL